MNKSYLRSSFYTGIIILLLFSFLPASAQEKVHVTAVGSYASSDMTPEQLKLKAIDDAKRDALIKAGVGETIQVSDFLYTFDDNEKFKDIFQDFTSTEAGGEVMVESILSENITVNEFKNLECNVEISATVFIHKEKKDPAMTIKVEGIEDSYKNNTRMNFSVTPSVDGYLKIFNVSEEETTWILYPYKDDTYKYLNDDAGYQLKAMKKTVFPVNPNVGDGYTLEINKPDKDKEPNLLIFVFTRENIPFMEDAGNLKNIMAWIYSIPPDKRIVKQVGFVISR